MNKKNSNPDNNEIIFNQLKISSLIHPINYFNQFGFNFNRVVIGYWS